MNFASKKPKRVRKFIKAERLTLNEVIIEVLAHNYVFWLDRPCHPAWIRGLQLGTLKCYCDVGHFHRAKINPEWTPPNDE